MSGYQHQIQDIELHEIGDELLDLNDSEQPDDPTDPNDTHAEGVDNK